jgi:hypothetical protein
MSITGFGLIDSPVGEEVDKIIDGTNTTKFLDFELGDGMGFTVDTGFTNNVIAIDLTTADDFEVRDPIDFEVLGSSDGTTFTSIATGTVDCILDRLFTRNYPFTNTEFYSIYRVNFTAPCDPSGGAGIPSIQLAEVQLYVPELGVNETTFNVSDVIIYPNPSRNVIQIETSGVHLLRNIEVIDLLGNTITTIVPTSTQQQQLSVEALTSGVYFVRISSNNGTVTKKLVVE